MIVRSPPPRCFVQRRRIGEEDTGPSNRCAREDLAARGRREVCTPCEPGERVEDDRDVPCRPRQPASRARGALRHLDVLVRRLVERRVHDLGRKTVRRQSVTFFGPLVDEQPIKCVSGLELDDAVSDLLEMVVLPLSGARSPCPAVPFPIGATMSMIRSATEVRTVLEQKPIVGKSGVNLSKLVAPSPPRRRGRSRRRPEHAEYFCSHGAGEPFPSRRPFRARSDEPARARRRCLRPGHGIRGPQEPIPSGRTSRIPVTVGAYGHLLLTLGLLADPASSRIRRRSHATGADGVHRRDPPRSPPGPRSWYLGPRADPCTRDRGVRRSVGLPGLRPSVVAGRLVCPRLRRSFVDGPSPLGDSGLPASW